MGRGRAPIIGFTGPAGSGKSTLINQLVKLQREEGRTVGVLAVDPSSPVTGGALLGDRIRMNEHSLDRGVFIHSLATRGQQGGVSRSAFLALCALGAAGLEVIIIETVGTGQGEIDVALLAETLVLVVGPDSGGRVQALKAGVLEVADIIVVNKADRAEAHQTALTLTSTLGLVSSRSDNPPAIIETIATQGQGLDTLLKRINDHCKRGIRRPHRQEIRWREVMLCLISSRVRQIALERCDGELSSGMKRLDARESDPFTEREKLLRAVMQTFQGEGGGV